MMIIIIIIKRTARRFHRCRVVDVQRKTFEGVLALSLRLSFFSYFLFSFVILARALFRQRVNLMKNLFSRAGVINSVISDYSVSRVPHESPRRFGLIKGSREFLYPSRALSLSLLFLSFINRSRDIVLTQSDMRKSSFGNFGELYLHIISLK